MARIKLQTELGPIEFASPEDAAAFFQAMRHGESGRNGRAPTEDSSEPIELRVLRRVQDAGPEGIASTELASHLGMVGPKGLSSIGRPMHDRLEQYNATFEDVIVRERVRKKVGEGFYTVWKPGPQLRRILNQIEEEPF